MNSSNTDLSTTPDRILDTAASSFRIANILLDRVLRQLRPRRLERGPVDLALQHPVTGEFAGLDVGEHALHLLLGLVGNKRGRVMVSPYSAVLLIE